MKVRTSLALIIVCSYVGIAWLGATIAPHDARATTAVFKDADTLIAPPFPIGTPGYLLGSDQYGRDILSRLLVGTRPTLLAMVVIASLRLIIGYTVAIIGAVAPPWLRLLTTSLTSICAIIPPFMGALLVLALAGTSPSLGVFVMALSWNSWVECAREVAQRLHQLRQQSYYHAARSSGDSEYSILLRHGGRAVSAPLVRLFVTELRSTLGLLAMLGFLGYFVGGATWMIVAGDAVPIGARASDYPELGQLLATSFERVLRPEYLFVVACYVALLIVGLQLLARSIEESHVRQQAWLSSIRSALEWRVARQHPGWLLLIPLMIVCVAYIVLSPTPPATLTHIRPAPLIMNRMHAWGMAGGDASMSYRVAAIHAFIDPTLLTLDIELSSAPIIAQDGSVYAYTSQHQLARWEASRTMHLIPLPFQPIGTPALDGKGRVVIVSPDGRIAHIDAQGNIAASYRTTTRAQATSAAVVGPDDMVAVTVVDRIEAFDARGEPLWATNPIDGYHETAPTFAPDGSMIMLANQAFDVVDGGRLPLFAGANDAQFENPWLISGADGYLYRRSGHKLTQLDVAGFVPSEMRVVDWDAAHVTMFFPQRSGVTVSGIVWQVYSGFGSNAQFVWLEGAGAYTSMPLPARTTLVAVADDTTALFCSSQRIFALQTQRARSPLVWQYEKPASFGECLGGAIAPTHSVIAYTHGLIWQAHTSGSP